MPRRARMGSVIAAVPEQIPLAGIGAINLGERLDPAQGLAALAGRWREVTFLAVLARRLDALAFADDHRIAGAGEGGDGVTLGLDDGQGNFDAVGWWGLEGHDGPLMNADEEHQ